MGSMGIWDKIRATRDPNVDKELNTKLTHDTFANKRVLDPNEKHPKSKFRAPGAMVGPTPSTPMSIRKPRFYR